MVLRAVIAVMLALAVATPAHAQMIGPGASMPCEWQRGTAGGTALACPLGTLRNIPDIEGGTASFLPDGQLDKPKLDLNISSGEHEGVRSRIALNPDTGGPGTVIFDGRRNKIASFYPAGIEFFAPVVFHDSVGSTGSGTPPKLEQQLLRLQLKAASLDHRLHRLQRRVARLLHRHPR